MKKFKFVFLAVILCCFATLIGVVGCTDKPTTEKPVEERKTSSSDPIIGTWFCEDEKIDELINKPNYYTNCKLYYIIEYNPSSESEYTFTIWSKCHSKDIADAWNNNSCLQGNGDMTISVKDIEEKHYAHTGRIYFSQATLSNTYHFVISADGNSFNIFYVNKNGIISESVILTFSRTNMSLDEFKALDVAS